MAANELVAIPPRFEYKYAVPTHLIPEIRKQIESICVLDKYSEAASEHRYVIRSLYLDGPGFPFHFAKIDRQPRRLKMRIRTYGERGSQAPVIFEIKKRIKDVIQKTRGLVPMPDWKSFFDDDEEHGELTPAQRLFFALRTQYDAQPTMLVKYEREAWVSSIDEYARLTFDTGLEYQSVDTYTLDGELDGYRALDHSDALSTEQSDAILELKFTEELPEWMEELISRFGISRRGFSKYCTGVSLYSLVDEKNSPQRRAAMF